MIKYLDLQKINASFEPELSEALLRVSHSGWYLHGEATARFEEEFAAYCGTSYCVGTGNGLDALTLIFLAYRELGVMNAGDEGSQALYPRASKVLRIPPFGKEEASGSC